jgi:hypothetical protein
MIGFWKAGDHEANKKQKQHLAEVVDAINPLLMIMAI